MRRIEPDASESGVDARSSLLGRASWAIVDQLLWSASNVVALLVAARALSVDAFGAFALAMVAYQLSCGLARATSTEPLLVRSGSSPAEAHDARQGALAANLVWGLSLAPLLWVAGLLLGGESGSALWAMALCLPALVLQDGWRYGQLVRNSSRAAVIADGSWLVVALVGFGLLELSGRSGAGIYVLVWGGAGLLVVAVPLIVTRNLPKPTQGVRWLRTNGDLGRRYVADFAATAGVAQGAPLLLAGIAGLSALAGFKAAQTTFGPLSVFYAGAYVTLVPEGQRAAAVSPKRLIRLSQISSIVFASVALTLLVLLSAMPTDWGLAVLGESWREADDLLLPLGLVYTAGALQVGAAAGLRSLSDARRVLAARLIVLPFAVGLPTAGIVIAGAEGMSWMLLASGTLSLLVYWRFFLSSVSSTDRVAASSEASVCRDSNLG